MRRQYYIAVLCCALMLPLGVLASDDGGGNAGGNSGGGNSGGGNAGGNSGGGNSGGGNAGGNSGGGNSGGGNAGGGRGVSRGFNDVPSANGWGSTPPSLAREAVAQGRALPLSTVLPTVSRAVAGQVLEVDLRPIGSGAWHYEVLVLTRDRHYQIVVVDAQLNRVLQIRRR
jgi:hypothetical protein